MEVPESIMDEAAIESGLAKEYKDDPKLLEFYKRGLMNKGWAGKKDETETAYYRAAMRLLGRKPSEAQLAARAKMSERLRQAEPTSGTHDLPATSTVVELSLL